MAEGTFSGIMLRAFCGALGLQGVDVKALLLELGVDRRQLSEGDARIPARLAFEVFERAPALTGDPAFGLHAALGMPVSLLEALDCAVREAGTASVALGRVCRYFSFLDDSHRLELRPAPGGWALEARRREGAGPGMPPVAAELLFAMIVARGRELTHTSMPLVEVGFLHDTSDASEHERFFGCPVRFGAASNHLVLEPGWLEVPIVQHVDTALGRLLSSQRGAERPSTASTASSSGRGSSQPALLAVYEPADAVRAVRVALCDEIRGEVPSLEQVAARLGTTSGALGDSLAAHGASWGELVDDARQGIAERCLASTALPTPEVAFLAGFDSTAAFEAAFSRWAGTSPAKWRADPASRRSVPDARPLAKPSGARGPLAERKSGTRATSRGLVKPKVARRR